MYLRWIWVPIVALAAGFFVGGQFSTFEGPSSTTEANITVGLTEEVRWPFFDAVLARQQGLLQQGNLADAATAETGIDHVSVAVQTSNVQNSTIQIAAVVQGGSGEAETYANALGEILIEANVADQRDSVVSEISSLTREITDLEVEIANLEASKEDLDIQWLEAEEDRVGADPEDAPSLRLIAEELDIERSRAQRQIDAQTGNLTNLRSTLATAERSAEQTGSPVEVSANAISEESSATDLRPIFAVLFFLLSLIAIPFLEQIFGKVRSLDHLGNLWPEARLVDARNRRLQKAPINPIDVARLAVVAESKPGDSVAVAGLASSKVTDFLAQSLADQGTDTYIVELASTQGMEQVVASDQLALVVPSGRVALRRANRSVDNLATLSADPVVVVLASKDKGSGVLQTTYGELTESTEEPATIRTSEVHATEIAKDDETDILAEEPVVEEVVEVEEKPQKTSRWGNSSHGVEVELPDAEAPESNGNSSIDHDDFPTDSEKKAAAKNSKKSRSRSSKKDKGKAA